MLTQERLKEILHYNRHVGVFVWRDKTRPRTYGKTAGSAVKNKGYVKLHIDGKDYPAHRLAWMYVHGEFPDGQIDHTDGDKSNNLISNLRVVTQAQNSMNMKRNASNTSGIKGVCFCKEKGKWEAAISRGGKRVYREWFDTAAEAGLALKDKRSAIHAEYANDGTHKYLLEEMLA